MASEKASRDWSGEVKELLVLSDRLAGEAGGLLETLSTRLGDLCRETAPTRLRAKTLSHASQNIRVSCLRRVCGLGCVRKVSVYVLES